MPTSTADPDLLRRLAIAVGDAADAALATAGAAARLSGDITSVLGVDPVARWGTSWARSLVERAELLDAITPVTGMLVDAAQLGLLANAADHALTTPLAIAWDDFDGAVTAAADAAEWLLAHQSAAIVAGFLATLDPAVATALARRQPELGDIVGVPLEMTFAANRRRIELAIAELDWQLARFDPADTARLAAEREVLLGMLPRSFLVFDWSDDGLVAEWTGPLGADHVAVLVPGMSTDKMDTDTMAANAARMLRFDRGGDLAVVTALIYDAPEGIDTLLITSAYAGVAGLARLIDVLPVSDRHLTLVGHSYGSLLLGVALADGLAADLPPRHDVVLIGSPGTGADTAADLGLDPTRVWAGATADDIVVRLRRLGGLLGFPTAGLLVDQALGILPTDPEFGAQVFDAGEGGHSAYLSSETVAGHDGSFYRAIEVPAVALAAIVAIATARKRRRDATSEDENTWTARRPT